MGKWSASSGDANTVPNWYTDLDERKDGRPNHPNEATNMQITESGWEKVVSYTDSSGATRTKREVVVADRELASTINTIRVMDLRWGNVATQNGIGIGNGFTFVVTFNQPMVCAAPPTWKYHTYDEDAVTANDATYISGNTTNRWTFEGTANGRTSVSDVRNVLMNGMTGTMANWDPLTNTEGSLTITTGDYEEFLGTSLGAEANARYTSLTP